MPPKSLASLPRVAWWDKPEGPEAARALYSQGQSLELVDYGRRYRDALLYRLVTGDESPDCFSYWLSGRVGPALSGLNLANYQEPAINIIASALEVFENRIGTLRPFVQVKPNGADIATRMACRQAEHYIDALFDEVRLYDTTRGAFRDGGTWGTAFIKVSADADKKKLVVERVLRDEILVAPDAARMGKPGALIQRRYISRSDAEATYVDTAPTNERDAIASAIRTAPKAFAGNFWSSGGTQDEQIALLEGWKLPGPNGDPGVRVLALNNYELDREDWKRDHFPFGVFRWTPNSVGFWGGSLARAMLPYQVKVNKWEERIDANGDRMAYSGWKVKGNTQLKAEALGGRPGRIIRTNGGDAEAITVTSNAPDAYAELERWMTRGLLRVGLSQQQVAGLKAPGITSGAALRTMIQIEDSIHKGLQIGLERLVKDVGELAIEAAEEINLPVVIRGARGGLVSWKDLKLGQDQRTITVYPVSALPNDPEGRLQQIADDYADGLIDKRTLLRLRNMGDQESYALLATSGDDLIESMLDEIVVTGKYVPPEPFDDLPSAIAMAQNRYWLEKRLKTPRKVLRQLQAFMVALSALAESGQQFLAPPAPSPGAGMQMPAGAPAAPPQQITPSITAPVAAAA